jgi:hypothetical protein
VPSKFLFRQAAESHLRPTATGVTRHRRHRWLKKRFSESNSGRKPFLNSCFFMAKPIRFHAIFESITAAI